MYQAILLDLYGTLVHDDEGSVDDVCVQVADLIAVDPSAIAAEWSRRLEASAEMAYGADFRTLADLTLGSLAEAVANFGASVDVEPICRKHLQSWRHPPLYDDSRPFLDAVKVPVCLVSDVDQDDLTAVLRCHGVAVAAAVTSEEARAYKPRPEPFQLALARLGLGAGDVIHIGNSASSDVAGAAALGIDTAFLDRAGDGLPPGVTATYTAATLTALLPQVMPC
ncbi:HAD family hydrolase [Micromonospora sp. ALFpr18c]|uniref:HAD family hydrolase n=1 Tax=unclassified Micromonospora TaxID=2617518 RepID=UPI00124B5522|nr:HAD family hydrolase [Micromonospora sp. ALFpr18c]KAB1948940.1 HAD family hydrolase [Micromonospora sp. ALFpr18c]